VVGSICCAGAGDGCTGCTAWTGASVAGCVGRSTVLFGFGRIVWVRLAIGEAVAGVGLAEREGRLLARAVASLALGGVPVRELVIATIVTTATAATAIMAATPHTAGRRRPARRRIGPFSLDTHET
jgi:hypothetical protein